MRDASTCIGEPSKTWLEETVVRTRILRGVHDLRDTIGRASDRILVWEPDRDYVVRLGNHP